MEKKIFCSSQFPLKLLFTVTGFLLIALLPKILLGQNIRPLKGEKATCEIKVSSKEVVSSTSKSRLSKRNSKTIEHIKSYKPGINELGYFHRVSNIQPLQKIPVQVDYPDANVGDKVVIAVADGGTLDNKAKVQVAQLNNEKKLSFNFLAGKDAGIYRIFLRKGSDTKVVQLWVAKNRYHLKIKLSTE